MSEDSQRTPTHPPGMSSFDPARILRASSVRYGDFRARGAPAILLGVSAVVVAAGAMRALQTAAPTLGEALREATRLAQSLRETRRLNP